MDKKVTKETKDRLLKSYPFSDKWEKRRVLRVSMENAWYAVGDIITVKQFATFGAFDVEDRWVNYWDLSLPILREISAKERQKLLEEEKTRIRLVRSELRKWDDIPLTWKHKGLCEILQINPDKAGRDFIYGFLIDHDDDKRAKYLYDIRGHEYKEAPKKSFLQKLFS